MKRALPLGAALTLAACGGAEPPPLAPIQDEVALLVKDDFLMMQDCPNLGGLELRGELDIAGIVGVCRITVGPDGAVLSLCEEVPGKRERELELVYFAVDAQQGPLRLVETPIVVDLTRERSPMVEVDFSAVDVRTFPDEDDDGASNLDEVCQGTDPYAP